MEAPPSTLAVDAPVMPSPSRWPTVGAIVACVLPVLWFLPMVLRGEVLFGSDINIHWVFNHDFLGRELGAGRFPLWNPHYLCGMPFLAGYQTNVLYPPAWCSRWLTANASVTLLIASHLALAAVGGWWCARRLGVSVVPAVIAGWVVGWSGFAVAHSYGGHLPIVQVWAWIPWLWGTLHRLRDGQGVGHWAPVALCTTMLLLAGSAQIAWIGLVGGSVLAVGWAWGRPRSEWQRPALAAVGALALGGALAAPQLLPTVRYSAESARTAGMPDRWYGEHTLRPANLSLWVTPAARGMLRHPFPTYEADGSVRPRDAKDQRPEYLHNQIGFWWEQTGHVGVVPLYLAVLGLLATSRRRRWTLLSLCGIGFALAVAMGPLIVGLGDYGRWLAAPFTAAGRFRAPVRYLALPTLGLALLAAEGARCWLACSPDRARQLALRAAAVTGGVLVLLLVPAWVAGGVGAQPTDGSSQPGALWWSAIALAVAPAIAIVGLAAVGLARGRHPGAIGAVLVVGCVAGLAPTFGAALVPFPRQISDTIFRGPSGVLPELRETPGRARVIRSEANVLVNSGMVTGLEMVEGFDPLLSAHYNRVLDRIESSPPRPDRMSIQPQILGFGSMHPVGSRWLDILNTRWVWELTPFRMGRQLAAGERRVGKYAIERPNALPRAWLVASARTLDAAPMRLGPASDAVLQAVEAATFDPAREAVVELVPGGGPLPDGGQGSGGTVTPMSAERPTVVSFEINATGPSLLIWSVPWTAGWQAHVDGGPPIPPHRVDGVIMGTPVPEGSHRVEFRYHAPGLWAGCWLALLAALAAGGVAVWQRRQAVA